MEKFLATLNKAQREAVETTEGPVLVLSGAGTGKTRVLVARIAHILAKGLARPWEILALTFTNKAANEMKSRIAALTSENSVQGISEIWCGTFHSICLRILRRNTEAAGLRPDFLIYGEDEQKAVLKDVILNLGLDIKQYVPSEWVERISFFKDTGRGAARENFDRIFDAYNGELARLGGVDFADIINKTILLFECVPDVLQKYGAQFKYILVDEYQDTNARQNRLLKLLAGNRAAPNICCVGDDDQSIYSWRGAEIKNILNFAREYPGAKIIRLEQNYRSTGNILAAANALIRHNEGRLGKDLRTDLGDGEKVRIVSAGSCFDEARIIADRISESASFSDNAVLIRSGSLSRVIEEEFARRQIPYRLIGAQKFYDRAEIRDVIAYARLLAADFDDLSLARVISRPRRGIGDTTLDAVQDSAKQKNTSMMAALRMFPLKPKQAAAAAEFLTAFDFNWRDMSPKDAVETLLDRAGYLKMWNESKDADKEDRLKNIRELISGVIAHFDNIQDFLEQASLMTAEPDDAGGAAAALESGNVSIMTIHAAKGLEFENVFLPAWEDKIFPNEMAVDDGGLEEERRLAYVAITRARRRCTILYSLSRQLFGQTQYNQPSRFIQEMGAPGADNGDAAPKKTRDPMVGKMISHPDFGTGVVMSWNSPDGEIKVAFKSGVKIILPEEIAPKQKRKGLKSSFTSRRDDYPD